MEKEMKKLLLVAVSVGVFLLVTITVAISLLTPKTQMQDGAFYSSIPFTQGRVEPTTGIVNDIHQQPAEPRGNNNIEISDIVTISDRNNGDSFTIQIPTPTTAAVPETRLTTTTATRPASPPAQVTRTAPSTNTAPATAARPVSPRTVNDYWIQIGAYSAMVRAEDVKERLAKNGLISIIETRMIDGQNLYRVRLGPYTSDREANHWLAIVKTIDGFHESQVRQTVRQQ